MTRKIRPNRERGFGVVEAVVGAALLSASVSGAIFVASELNEANSDARVRNDSLNVGTSAIEATIFSGQATSNVVEYHSLSLGGSNKVPSQQSALENGIITTSSVWEFRNANQRIELKNAVYFSIETVGNIATGSEADSGSGSGTQQSEDGGSGSGNEGSSDSGNDSGSTENSSDSGEESGSNDSGDAEGENSESNQNPTWSGSVAVVGSRGEEVNGNGLFKVSSGDCNFSPSSTAFGRATKTCAFETSEATYDISAIITPKQKLCSGSDSSYSGTNQTPRSESFTLTASAPDAVLTVELTNSANRCESSPQLSQPLGGIGAAWSFSGCEMSSSDKHLEVTLLNNTDETLRLDQIEIVFKTETSSTDGYKKLKKIKIGGNTVFNPDIDEVPARINDWEGSDSRRDWDANSEETLKFEFDKDDGIGYNVSILLTFDDGSSIPLSFTPSAACN